MDPFNRDLNLTHESDDSSPDSVYSGFVESLSATYMEDGLLRIRIPILHGDMPIERLPWAEMTHDMRDLCRRWDRTGPTRNSSDKNWPGVPPYNHLRKGRHMIRKGDRVQTILIDGNINHIWVTSLLEACGEDEGEGINPNNSEKR